ncbi:MAG TPA: glycosyl hydrolase, partial [Lacipirellulaceae bacterium]|nr:glycosyl hydrolase [Lacipirellulaceae bacterium]
MASRISFASALRHMAMAALLMALAGAATALRAEEAISPALRTSATPALDLAVGWRQPPLEARTRCWWWWLNGNVTAEAITRDLEAMKAKGLGGANIIDANGADQRNNRPVPHGPDFASPQWRRLFLHALREADRLELELGFNIQSGWNLGGPRTPAEDAAKKLAFSSLDVQGPAAVQQNMPAPPVVGDYYQDVALLAIPLPDDGAELTRIAGYEQKTYDKYPGAFTAGDASHLLDAPPVAPGAPVIAMGAVVDVTARLDAQGRVAWDAPPGRWRLLRIGYTLAGSRVSTQSDGWDGWAIDYLDPGTFERYWQAIVEPMLAEAGPPVGRSLKFLHTESWELGPVNWTPRFA